MDGGIAIAMEVIPQAIGNSLMVIGIISMDPDICFKRIQAHQTFDQIWKNHILSKSDAYRWIADKFCLTAKEAHIGEFDLYMCEQLICESMKILRNNHIPLRAAS